MLEESANGWHVSGCPWFRQIRDSTGKILSGPLVWRRRIPHTSKWEYKEMTASEFADYNAW